MREANAPHKGAEILKSSPRALQGAAIQILHVLDGFAALAMTGKAHTPRIVIPAQAGIQPTGKLGSRLRGSDGK